MIEYTTVGDTTISGTMSGLYSNTHHIETGLDIEGDGVANDYALGHGTSVVLYSGDSNVELGTINVGFDVQKVAFGDIDGNSYDDMVIGTSSGLYYVLHPGYVSPMPANPFADRTPQLLATGWTANTRDISALQVKDVDGTGFDDVYVAYDAGTGTSADLRRVVYYIDHTSVLGSLTPTDMQPTAEDGLFAPYAEVIDLNSDGLLDVAYCLTYAPCRTALATPTARTDSAAIEAEQHLKDNLVWTGIGESATGSEGGGQVDGGIITTDNVNYPFTTTVGSLSNPSDYPEQQPPCHYPGGQVQPVTTHFYLDFPTVPCVPPGPKCVLLDPIEAMSQVFPAPGDSNYEACSYM
jgi:hypothetical protein